MRVFTALCAGLASLFGLPGCQHTEERRAALITAEPENREALKSGLADAMGVRRIKLGPSDPSREPYAAVLPPALGPYEGASPAVPTVFDLYVEDGRCVAVRRDTGDAHALPDVRCFPAPGAAGGD